MVAGPPFLSLTLRMYPSERPLYGSMDWATSTPSNAFPVSWTDRGPALIPQSGRWAWTTIPACTL